MRVDGCVGTLSGDRSSVRRIVLDRRCFLLTALATVAAWAGAADAQAPRRIAFLCPSSCSNLPATLFSADLAFLKGLEQEGFPNGPALYFDMAGAGVGHKRLPERAEPLTRRKADVIVAFGNAAARAARGATSTIPIVMVGVADPVETGLIASLGRPGGNLTGLAVPYEQLVAKAYRVAQGDQSRPRTRCDLLESRARSAGATP